MDSLCVKVLAPAFALAVSFRMYCWCLMLIFAVNAHHWAIARSFFFLRVEQDWCRKCVGGSWAHSTLV